MSKHFELMQQMERERLVDADVEVEKLPPFRPTGGHSVQAAASQWASEEALRLVQQVFLLQSQEPPRVVVFAGVDPGNGCSRICASVAETLAANDRGRVCLVEANFRSPRPCRPCSASATTSG